MRTCYATYLRGRSGTVNGKRFILLVSVINPKWEFRELVLHF